MKLFSEKNSPEKLPCKRSGCTVHFLCYYFLTKIISLQSNYYKSRQDSNRLYVIKLFLIINDPLFYTHTDKQLARQFELNKTLKIVTLDQEVRLTSCGII